MKTESTRETFGNTLVELGKSNQNIVVIGADLNKSTFASLFGREFPERFFDVGAAEQNMMSIAAGLAFSGKISFVNTFAVFGTSRPHDQIRVGIAQAGANVKIVCTHAGITVGEDGISAQSIEDIALMCALPGVTVIVPADAPETAQAIKVAAREYGPFYIRLSRSSTPVIHSDGYSFQLGKGETVREGKDVTIFATGIMVATAVESANRLVFEGIECRVVNMATLKPLDEEIITRAALETGAIVTAEEHYMYGGLGSLIAQTVAKTHPVPMEVVAQDRYAESGKPELLLEKYGLSSADIEMAVQKVVRRKGA